MITATPATRVQLAKDELEPLRVTMRDVQQSTADYYAATATGGDLGRPVRAFLVGAQTLNERFAKAVADGSTYVAIVAGADQVEAGLINGIKYARNVDQHVLHIVRPADNLTLVGGTLGMRVYALWDAIPAEAHAKLYPATQKLKPAYDAVLLDHEVTGTMFALLRFYARIAPDIVHRDHRGEWTGFPLMNQPGMQAPLHPEEPGDIKKALDWLNGRRPGGDARVICGQHCLNGTSYAFGHTFIGRYSFAPWIESVDQVNFDIGLGYAYLAGDPTGNVEDVSTQFPQARQGGVLMSQGDLDAWAQPVSRIAVVDDWCADSHAETWHRYVTIERGDDVPVSTAYELRRARRLNALVPPSARYA
jgi:hypothetical protein